MADEFLRGFHTGTRAGRRTDRRRTAAAAAKRKKETAEIKEAKWLEVLL